MHITFFQPAKLMRVKKVDMLQIQLKEDWNLRQNLFMYLNRPDSWVELVHLLCFNIMTFNIFSAVIDLGRELTGMLFIQTSLLWRQKRYVWWIPATVFLNK